MRRQPLQGICAVLPLERGLPDNAVLAGFKLDEAATDIYSRFVHPQGQADADRGAICSDCDAALWPVPAAIALDPVSFIFKNRAAIFKIITAIWRSPAANQSVRVLANPDIQFLLDIHGMPCGAA